MNQLVDVVVLGGGAAGLFCAAVAGAQGRSVVVLEHQARPGNKVLISGGGRCNFTNLGAAAANYVTHGSPHFPKSALARYTPAQFLQLVEQHGIEWHERKHRQLFCNQSSRQILALLEAECAAVQARILPNSRIESVQRDHPSDARPWVVRTPLATFQCSSVVVATGGLSFPRLGATSFGHDLARAHGLRVIPPRPGLVPLTWLPNDSSAFADLSGIAIECEVRTGPEAPAFREAVLFTHRGLSGPAILQASSHRQAADPIHVSLLPDLDVPAWLSAPERRGQTPRQALRTLLPERLANAWCAGRAPDRPIGQCSRRDLVALAEGITDWTIQPAGDEGYPKAEVTLGGVDTDALSSKTLEARDVPGLFFIGEVVDVTGWLGGYNFQWAWASAHAAGLAA